MSATVRTALDASSGMGPWGPEVVHRLGVSLGVLLGLVWITRWATGVRRERTYRRRLDRMLGRQSGSAGSARDVVRGLWGSRLPWLGVVGAGWVLVGGLTGIVLGLGVAAGLWRWRRRRPSTAPGESPGARTADARVAARQLPLAADLLAACIAAGAGPVSAARAVGEALGGPVGDGLARAAAEARLGGPPGEAWRRLAEVPGAGRLAQLLRRADESGLPAAAPVARLAAEARVEWSRTATARARRAAVTVTAPVGLCFLPAFIALGVLPVVIGLASGVMDGGG